MPAEKSETQQQGEPHSPDQRQQGKPHSPGQRPPWVALAAAAVIPLAILTLLRAANVPLGCPGRFVYLYSPVAARRFESVPSALAIAAASGLAVWLIAAARRSTRLLGFALLAGGSLALGVWTYVAPPDHELQHAFNMQSPSQDGAFVYEGLTFASAPEYLRSFPQHAARPPELMRGTRVISNPPGATLLAYGCRLLIEATPPLWRYARHQFEIPNADQMPEFIDTACVGLVFTWVLTGLWLLSGVFLYLIGRVFFEPPTAAALCICLLFNPATLLFTPGKDAAQLLTAALMLWLWFLAYRRRSAWLAGAAGAAFTLGVVVSLVHVWLAAIALVAVLAAEAPQLWSPAKRLIAPAAAGVVAVCALAYVTYGWNVPATLVAVARSQAAVTRGPGAMPWLWQCLGILLFVLFAGPALWAGCLSAGRPLIRFSAPDTVRAAAQTGISLAPNVPAGVDRRLGVALLLSTLGVLVVTVGFTNIETPRLWIPFLPPLLLGVLLLSDGLQRFGSRTRVFLAVLVVVHIAGSLLIWALMDAREAEHRLLTGSLFS